ncbi:MAG: helix-turn-helix transcriptional regulator [Rhodanobacteraceae bacterium]|nr:helix-turn-helix transcriptional regulator [Rhodanobacteraceae bacterium]
MKNSDIKTMPHLPSPEPVTCDDGASTLVIQPPPARLARHVFAFVHRNDHQGGQVVRWLPEPRMSIQIFLADPCFVRENPEGAAWRSLPRIGLWGPRYNWAYGYIERHIRVYAVGLTPTGLRALWPGSAAELVNQVVDLREHHRGLAEQLALIPDENFDAWRQRAAEHLHDYLKPALQPDDALSAALNVLATGEGRSVADAAAIAGLSERQFRRVFEQRLGVSPKRYQRAIRVDRMLKQLHAQPWEGDEFADQPIPFADQPHAIREFRAMTGITPGQYLHAKQRGDATLRSVPMPGIAPPAADTTTDAASKPDL